MLYLLPFVACHWLLYANLLSLVFCRFAGTIRRWQIRFSLFYPAKIFFDGIFISAWNFVFGNRLGGGIPTGLNDFGIFALCLPFDLGLLAIPTGNHRAFTGLVIHASRLC